MKLVEGRDRVYFRAERGMFNETKTIRLYFIPYRVTLW